MQPILPAPSLRPTPRALLLAAAGTLLAALPVLVSEALWPFWAVFWATLLLGLGVDVLLGPRRAELACDVATPGALYIGERDEARVSVSLPTRRTVRFDLQADLSEILEPQEALRGSASREGTTIALPLVPRRRGVAVLRRIWLRYRGPLGLVQMVVAFDLDRELPVTPNIRPVKQTALRFFSDRDFRAGLKVERYTGDGTEFDSMREYIRGLDPRSLDWKATARHRKLICRQNRAERNHQVVFAVDTGHLMCERLAGIPKLDHALNAALLLAYVCLRTGDRVGLYTFGARVGLSARPQGGLAAHRRLTLLSAEVAYSTEETNFTLGLTTLSQRLQRRSLVIVLTDFIDTVSAELMMENLHRLARKHLILFVALQDPWLPRTVRQAPRDSFSISQSVVSRTLLGEREVVLRRLQRFGVLCIDSPPEQVGSELINRYLDIKRKERI